MPARVKVGYCRPPRQPKRTNDRPVPIWIKDPAALQAIGWRTDAAGLPVEKA